MVGIGMQGMSVHNGAMCTQHAIILCRDSERVVHAGQGFEEVNGTSAVPNSDLPSWVVTEAQATQQHRGQAVDVPDRFTIPVSGAVSGANPLTSGQQTGARVISALLRFAATGHLYYS